MKDSSLGRAGGSLGQGTDVSLLNKVDCLGYDPYDALTSRVLPSWVRRSRRARQAVIQIRKRIPIGPLLLFRPNPIFMAKGLGCLLTAATRVGHLGLASDYLGLLRDSGGTLGRGAYGYEFDVQTRWAFYPAGSPNLIATVFVARGLGTAAIVTGDTHFLSDMAESAKFLRAELFANEDRPFFRYTLTSNQLVHNANLLGAGLCAMVGSLQRESVLLEMSLACANTSMSAQRPDGSWPYGDGDSLGWSDNFHTAYNLDGLLQVWLATGDPVVRESLDRGVRHWVRDFFGPNGEPEYYPSRAYPYDIHSAGTAVDVAARLATWGWDTAELAERVAAWTKMNLVDSCTGRVYYQKHRLWTDKRYFVRWGAAHWALGQSSLALLREGRRDPLEEAVASKSGVVSHEG